jgi:hypothetical protein
MDFIFEYVKEARDATVSTTSKYPTATPFRSMRRYAPSTSTAAPNTSVKKDSLDREKPFYNIVNFRVNIALRSTDLDTKDVNTESEGIGGDVQSFLLTLKNRNWMKANNFGVFLNKMGFTRAKCPGVRVKKTEQNGVLALHVVPWRDLITDQVDIKEGPKSSGTSTPRHSSRR